MILNMEFKIFDVRHGFCAALIGNNHLTLIDCGHDNNYEDTPLEWLYSNGYRHIDSLIISNFDQDHISDIETIRDNFTVGKLVINRTISKEELQKLKLKNGYITDQMNVVLANMEIPNFTPASEAEISIPEAQFNFYNIIYPYETDTNNLSLVTFIQFGTSKILYAGDLERKGWSRFLTSTAFLSHLRKVNVFIASHHGRENGYCREIFDYCSPEIVIVSDQERTYGTQNHDLYSKHVQGDGLNFGTILVPKYRKVLTTRNDGDITIRNQYGKTSIRTEKG